MINYEAVWQVLADLITELRKAGVVVPSHVMKDLRSAKTTMQILKADRDNPDHLLRIEELLGNVEIYIMSTAQKEFETQTVNDWMDRLKRERSEAQEEIRPSGKFYPGVPRDKHWIRIKTTNDIPPKRIEQVAAEEGLEYKTQENGYIIVYGEKSSIQNFIKKMAELHED